MLHALKFAGALALAALVAIPAANARSMGGGHGGGGHGGAHISGGGGGGRAIGNTIPHVSKGASFHAPAVRHVAPHVQGRNFGAGHPVRSNSYGNWNGGDHHGHHRHHRHNRFFIAAPLYDYGDYDRGGCRWLWKRYLYTGNPVWKHRYYQCIE